MNHAERYVEICRALKAAEGRLVDEFLQARNPHSKEKYPPVQQGMPYTKVYMWNLLVDRQLQRLGRPSGKGEHFVVKHVLPPSKDNSIHNGHRIALNSSFIRTVGLETQLTSKKMEITWVAAYVADIFPDETVPGWENFELSHRCVQEDLARSWTCVDPDCLVWESKRQNQSRGHSRVACMKICRHCPKTICRCNSIHDPCCL